MKRVLVLSPHPDDETIGCGGTLRAHANAGDRVEVIFLTSGEKGGHGRSASETLRLREREAKTAAPILGLARLEFWRAPDGGLKPTPALTTRLRRKIRGMRPDRIYVPHEREMHPDHRGAVRLVRAALAGLKSKPPVLGYEVWTPIQKLAEIVDISACVAAKRRAIRAYRSQCAVVDFEAAILGLNRYRGEMHSWPGGPYAEVFTTVRA